MLGVGPFAFPQTINGGFSFSAVANLPAGPREWTLQAFNSAGTLTGVFASISVQDLATAP